MFVHHLSVELVDACKPNHGVYDGDYKYYVTHNIQIIFTQHEFFYPSKI